MILRAQSNFAWTRDIFVLLCWLESDDFANMLPYENSN